MSVSKLIEEFSKQENLPIDVNDVVAALRERGIKDEIYFFPADLDPEILRGNIVHWEWPTDETQETKVSCADIYYSEALTDDWQRLVCCKELLHILDPDWCAAASQDEVKRLTERIVLPPELQDPLKDGAPTVSDRFSTFQAVAVLFPLACRELLLPPFKAGKLSIADISRLSDLPQRYVALVMGDSWPAIMDVLLSFTGEAKNGKS